MTKSVRSLALLLVAGVTGNASAAASTVDVQVNAEVGYGLRNEISFVAEPGEANIVTIDWEDQPGSIRIRDAGSVMTPGEFCVGVDEHTVQCTAEASDGGVRALSGARFALGDGDDEFRNNGHRTPVVVVDGGSGSDRMVGGGGADRLNGGGGGRDQLFGAGGVDELTDGDIDGAGLDGDLLDGGSATNWISYRQRKEGVDVDLAAAASRGATGEGDVLIGIQHIIGGEGDDRLAGDERSNVLDGGPGNDHLEARGGKDDLRNGEWTSCGARVDVLWGHTFDAPSQADDLGLLERDCERLFVNGSYFRTYPQRSRDTLTFPTFTCPLYESDDDLYFTERCSVAITIHEEAGARRVLAKGRLRRARWDEQPVDVRLTALGRRKLDEQGTEIVDIELRGRDSERRTWSIRL